MDMKISVICFTKSGYELMEKIDLLSGEGVLSDNEFVFYCKCENLKDKCKYTYVNESLKDWTRSRFEEHTGLIFIGAMGIAVRAISDYVDNKLTDSMVIVIDDKGKYVIPVLSGHVGGANEMAKTLSDAMQALPVITTSTDNHNKFAVDVWARKNGLFIENKEGIVKVSSKLLNDEQISIVIDSSMKMNMASVKEFDKKYSAQIRLMLVDSSGKAFDIFDTTDRKKTIDDTEDINVDVYVGNKEVAATLILRPKMYVIGMGCRRDKEYFEIKEIVDKVLAQANIGVDEIESLATIDVKKDEKGMLRYAEMNGLEFITYSAEELSEVKGEFEESEFVRNTIGVGNVCERAAVLRAGTGAGLIVHKTACDGVTVAIARKNWILNF